MTMQPLQAIIYPQRRRCRQEEPALPHSLTGVAQAVGRVEQTLS